MINMDEQKLFSLFKGILSTFVSYIIIQKYGSDFSGSREELYDKVVNSVIFEMELYARLKYPSFKNEMNLIANEVEERIQELEKKEGRVTH